MILYSQDGQEHSFIYEIDAAEAVASGNYFKQKPVLEEKPEEEKKSEKKSKEPK